MYSLYFLPSACSLATQIVLLELEEAYELIHMHDVAQFEKLNPAGTVPVLADETNVYNEGAAILLHLLTRKKNHLFPEGEARQQAIENMLFANATMHPAYGRLFFIDTLDVSSEVKQHLMHSAADHINQLWKVVEQKLTGSLYIGGDSPGVTDILLSVYSRWGDSFPVDISIGAKARRMIDKIMERNTAQAALRAENTYQLKAG